MKNVSEIQLAANRRNAYKHGLTASVEARFNLTGEAQARFEELLAVYKEEFKIQGQLESDLLLQFVWSIFSMERDGLKRWPGDYGKQHISPEVWEWCAEQDRRQAALVA